MYPTREKTPQPVKIVDQSTKLKQTRQKLLNIFIFYASFGDRDNYRLLKIQNFRRMLLDAQIARTEEQGKHYDIMYYQNKNKTGLTFQEFVDLLPKLAQSHYSGRNISNRKEMLVKLMNEHLLILEEFIISKTEMGEDLSQLNASYDSKSFEVLARVKSVLEKIYRQYWPNETVQDKHTHDKSLLALFEFLRQFELCPALITKSVSFLAYEHLTNSDMEHAGQQKFDALQFATAGRLFTFKRFIKMLILVALIGNKRISMEKDSQPRKVVKLLERMEISSGFHNIEKTIQTSQLSKTTLLVNEEILQDIEEGFVPGSRYSTMKKRAQTEHQQQSESPKYMQDSIFLPEEEQIIMKYNNELKAKFQIYCSYGDTLNTLTLKSIKISKILKEIGVLSVLSQAQIDLMISNLSRFSQSGKIEYPQFLKLLCQVSSKAKIDLSNLVECVIAHEGSNHEYARKVEQLIERTTVGSQSAEVYTLLREIDKPLKMYYDYYTSGRNMIFSQFSKFMYDFQIFPFLISKPRLFSIFNEAVSAYDRLSQQSQSRMVLLQSNVSPKNYSSVKSKKVLHQPSSTTLNQKNINYEMFSETIGLCAQEIQQSQLKDFQKLLLLLERMNDSKGPKLITKALGNTRNSYGMKTDFLAEVRRKYAYFYEKDIFRQDKKAKQEQAADFDSIFLG